jgi:hypothetical protein
MSRSETVPLVDAHDVRRSMRSRRAADTFAGSISDCEVRHIASVVTCRRSPSRIGLCRPRPPYANGHLKGGLAAVDDINVTSVMGGDLPYMLTVIKAGDLRVYFKSGGAEGISAIRVGPCLRVASHAPTATTASRRRRGQESSPGCRSTAASTSAALPRPGCPPNTKASDVTDWFRELRIEAWDQSQRRMPPGRSHGHASDGALRADRQVLLA